MLKAIYSSIITIIFIFVIPKNNTPIYSHNNRLNHSLNLQLSKKIIKYHPSLIDSNSNESEQVIEVGFESTSVVVMDNGSR